MRPSMRLLNLEVTSLQGTRSPSRTRSLYVCSSCRQEARPRPLVVARQFVRNASNDTAPLTERMRRRIWGTENPPGMKDPYGGKGILEQKFGRGENQNSVVPEEEVEAREQRQGQGSERIETRDGEQEVLPEGIDADYVPVTSWEGLQRVGHLGRWSDYPPSEGDVYNSFMLKKKLSTQGHVHLAAHQTAVELCLLHALNKPLTSICDVVEHDESVFKMIWECKIQPGANGQWDGVLEYPNKEAETALVYIFEQIGGQPEAVAAEATGETSTEAEYAAEDAVEASPELQEAIQESVPQPQGSFFGYTDAGDKGFLSLSLNDPAVKFAFLKRFYQISGHYFPDPTIHSISNVKQAVDYVHTVLNPKPTKLADQLATKDDLQSQPNVKIFSKKQRSMDRDEELGRKKVIEAELRARGLIDID